MAIIADASGRQVADQKFNSHTRTAANLTAILLLTPAFPGEIVLALDTGIRYRGLELVAGRWGQVFVEM